MIKGLNFRLTATNKAGPAMASFRKGMKGIRSAQNSVVKSNKGFMKGMNANRRIVQQVGMQVSDLGVQIAGGQSAILSLTQNVPQVVQMFGAWGGILAAVITLVGTFTLVMLKSGKGINDIIPFTGALADEFTALAAAFGKAKELIFDGLNLVINNLDVLFVSLSLVAGLMAGKFAMSVLRATGTLRLLNTAMLVTRSRGLQAGAALVWKKGVVLALAKSFVVLKRAIMLTGIGALVVVAGYLITKLLDLKKATGSWAAAFELLGRVAKETLSQLPVLLTAVKLKIDGAITGMTASFMKFVADTVAIMPDWANSVVGAVVAAAQGVGAAFGTMGAMFLAVSQNDFATATALGANLGKGVGNAYSKAIQKTYIGGEGSLTKKLAGNAESARELATSFSQMGDVLFKSAADAIPAWQELKSLLNGVDSKSFDIRDMIGKDKKSGELSDVEKKKLADYKRRMGFEQKWLVKRLKEDNAAWEQANADRLASHKRRMSAEQKALVDRFKAENKLWEDQQKRIEETRQKFKSGFQDMFKGLVTGSKSLKDTVLGMLDSLANKAIDMASSGIFDAIFGSSGSGPGGIFGGGGGGFFSKLAGSFFGSFEGGGVTKKAPRAGGVDGRGGKFAILHPNETVLDHEQGQGVVNKSNDVNGVTIVSNNYFNGVTHQEVMADVEMSQRQLERKLEQKFPSQSSQLSFNRNRGMVS